MGRAARDVTIPAARGWTPQSPIAAHFPEIVALRGAMQSEIREIEAKLDRTEGDGGDTSCPRLILRELRWRLEYTADTAATLETVHRLRAMATLPFPHASGVPNADGSYEPCTGVWF